jgi:hypothetical protein
MRKPYIYIGNKSYSKESILVAAEHLFQLERLALLKGTSISQEIESILNKIFSEGSSHYT